MRLYQGSSQEFIDDTIQNRISDKLRISFENYYGRRANPAEIMSWTNSLQFVKNLIERNSLLDNMIILECEIPYTNERIDCMLFGNGEKGDCVVIMELKQWSNAESCDVEGNVTTFVGGAKRMVPHPSYQVEGYYFMLKDFITIFEKEVNLDACVYCHNYSKINDHVIFSDKFRDILRQFPAFVKEDFESLGRYLKERLGNGEGLEIFNRFTRSDIRPCKKLLEHTSRMIDGHKAFTLIDEQITANNTILDRAKKSSKLPKKSVIIVKGGPGTGKSVIAINVLAELLSKGLVVYHATGSAAFTKTLRKIVGVRASKLFKYFNSFTTAKENEIDVLICDEAHRIRETSISWYTKMENKSGLPQVEELIKAAKVSIFFIDDYQIVRPTEIGSSDLIRKTAEKFNAEIFDFELKTQFRCSGSDGFLNWIDDVLGIRDTANKFLTKEEKMEFVIFDSPQKLYEAIIKRNEEKPNSARLVAGFCWPWSDPNPDGTLKDDVVIGDFRMTWEGKDGKILAKGIPPAPLWAHDPAGVNQVGSIYTIQGFEFDYVGVIIGKDLVYDPVKKDWIGKKEGSADAQVKRAQEQDFTKYVKNVYRVLLTRGMKGCCVYFMDKDTENFIRSRILK